MTHYFAAIAMDNHGGIGKGGHIPWNVPGDRRWFRHVTTMHGPTAVIMGRKTFVSLPDGPLPGRTTVVLTEDPDFVAPGALICHTLAYAVEMTKHFHAVCIAGGATVYAQAYEYGIVTTAYVTRIYGDYGCDVFMPRLMPANDWYITPTPYYGPDYHVEWWRRKTRADIVSRALEPYTTADG